MGRPRGAQRVLLALAAALLALAAWAGERAMRPAVVAIPDDPALALRLDLNSAGAADLETLPGVGAALAARIVAHRDARGPFASVDGLDDVPGIGAALLAKLRPYLTVRPAR